MNTTARAQSRSYGSLPTPYPRVVEVVIQKDWRKQAELERQTRSEPLH